MSTARATTWFHLPLLLLLGGLLYFSGLGNLGLTDRDEGSNAEAAREMIESGDYMSPTLNYEPRFAKPAFTYWIMTVAYRLFGVNEFSARLHSAVFGMLLLALQYGFLRIVRGPWFALVGSMMLLINVEMVAIGRVALTDSVLIFFTTLSLYGLWLGLYTEARWRPAIWLFYLGMAFGTLTKGPIGLLVPLLAAAAFFWMTGSWRDYLQRGRPLAGALLTVAIALPWYAGMWLIHGERYSTSAQADTVGRFFSMIGGHGGTVLFYVPIMLFGFFPWSGFALVELWQRTREWWRNRHAVRLTQSNQSPLAAAHPPIDRLDLFAVAWVLALFVFFSVSATRLPHYIGPMFPALAILATGFWQRATSERETPGLGTAFTLFAVIGYALGMALLSTPYLYETFITAVEKEFPLARQASPGIGPVVAGGLIVAGTALGHLFGRSEDRRPGAFWIAAASFPLALLMLIHIFLPEFHEHFVSPPQTLATIAGYNLGPNDRFITYGPHKPSWTFYARHKTFVVRPNEPDKLKAALDHAGRSVILLPKKLRENLPPETEKFEVLLERKGYILLANETIIKLPPKPEGPARPPIPEHAFPR
ncbi:MAG: glycosyltransferase family 39 protein [Nitrospiraceae bacterium]